MLHKRSSLKQSEGLCLNFPKDIFVKLHSELTGNTLTYFNSSSSIKERRWR